jgi:hypothetical protein
VFKEGSRGFATWVKKQEKRLYSGKAAVAVVSLNELDVSLCNRQRLTLNNAWTRFGITATNVSA